MTNVTLSNQLPEIAPTTTLTVTDLDSATCAKLNTVRNHQAVTATFTAFTATANGIKLVYDHECEFHTVHNFFGFVIDAFKSIALPLLALLWLAICSVFDFLAKPSTKEFVATKYEAARAWAAPRFDYSKGGEQKVS